MATIRFEVTNYTVSLHRAVAMSLDGRAVVFVALIVCKGSGQDEMIVLFQPEGEPLESNYYDAARRRGYHIRPSSELPWYVDLLRNEEPVFVTMDDVRPVFMFLSVRDEPVGEGELTAV